MSQKTNPSKRSLFISCKHHISQNVTYLKSAHCNKLSDAINIFPIQYILVELWPKWHFNMFPILAMVLHLHSVVNHVNWILFGCPPFHVVALILDAVRALAIIADTTFRTIRVLHYAYKGSRDPVLKIMKWKLVDPFLTRHSSLCSKGKTIQRCKARQSRRPLNVVPQSDNFVRNLFLQSIANCHSLMAGGTISKEPRSANGTIALESNQPCKVWISLKKWTNSFFSHLDIP